MAACMIGVIQGMNATVRKVETMVYWKGLNKILNISLSIVLLVSKKKMTLLPTLGCYNLCPSLKPFGSISPWPS